MERFVWRNRRKAGHRCPVRSDFVDIVLDILKAAAKGGSRTAQQVSMKLQNIGRVDGNILITLMDSVQHIPVAHDLVFVPVSWCCLFCKELLHACAGGNNALDLVRRFGTLNFCNLHQSIQLHRLLSDIHILPALAFMNLCNQIQNIGRPTAVSQGAVIKVPHDGLLSSKRFLFVQL